MKETTDYHNKPAETRAPTTTAAAATTTTTTETLQRFKWPTQESNRSKTSVVSQQIICHQLSPWKSKSRRPQPTHQAFKLSTAAIMPLGLAIAMAAPVLLALQIDQSAQAAASTNDNNNLSVMSSSLSPPPGTSALVVNGSGSTTPLLAATATATATAATAPVTPAEENMKFPFYMRTVATLACMIIFTIGICGNLLVPLVVIKTKYLRNSTNLFLINLSIADLLVLIVCMPTVLIELHSRPETWLLGEPMCKISNYVEMLAANGSIFTILAISFERYYAICKPLKAGYKCTRLRATVIICLIWLLASVLTSPILIMAKSSETSYIDGSLVYNCILETDSYWAKMYVFVSMFAFFCLPLFVLMLVYWFISKRLVREDLAMSCCAGASPTIHHHNSNQSANGIPITPTTISGASTQTRGSYDTGNHHIENNGHGILLSKSSIVSTQSSCGVCKKVGLHKTGSVKSISTFLSSLHQHHYYPFSIGCRAIDHGCNGHGHGHITSANANEPNRKLAYKRHKLLSNRALSLDQHLGAGSARRHHGQEDDHNHSSQADHDHENDDMSGDDGGAPNRLTTSVGGRSQTNTSSVCLDVKTSPESDSGSQKIAATFCGIPIRKCSQTLRLLPGKHFVYSLLRLNTQDGDTNGAACTLAATNGDLEQNLTKNLPKDSILNKSMGLNCKSNHRHQHQAIGAGKFASRNHESIDELSGSQTPFLNGSESSSGVVDNNYHSPCRQYRQLRSPNRRRRKLQSKKHHGIRSPAANNSNSETNKFRWIKRFSITSSTASVQTSSTTLPSDASVSPSMYHNANSNAQPRSPRSILHSGSQSRELNSETSNGPDRKCERKKTAHFDSDVIDVTGSLPEDEAIDEHKLHPNQQLGTTPFSSVSETPSSSPELSKSSSPDSMYRHDLQIVNGSGTENSSSAANFSREESIDEPKTIRASLGSNRRDLRRQFRANTKKAGSLDMTSFRHDSRSRVADNKSIMNRKGDDYKMHPDSYHHNSYNFFRFARGGSRRISQPVVCCHCHHGNHSPEMIVVQDLSKKQQMDSRRQVVIMLAFVVACFFLLFFPYRVFTIWLILSTEDQVQSLGMETYYNLTYFSRILIYLHSAINPIAYNLISTKFRRAFMSILLCRGQATRRQFTTEHRVLSNRAYSEDKRQSLRQSYR